MEGQSSGQSDDVSIVPQSVGSEQPAVEDARVPQVTSSTSNEFVHPHHPHVVMVDLESDVPTPRPTPITRETARIQDVCSTSESEDEDEPVSEQEQVREMPNLAAVALERLASRVQLQDELPDDDFRPLKKKCLPTAESDNENEVSLYVIPGCPSLFQSVD